MKSRPIAPGIARGFSLIEMIVVLAIISIITTIALLGQGSFNRSIILTDTAYTIAFTIRDAQSRGLASNVFSTVRNAGYGVHFSSATPKSYIEFADIVPSSPDSQGGLCPNHVITTGPEAKPGNCVYSNSSEIVRTFTLDRGFAISEFCGKDTSGVKRCSGYLEALDISFARPDTQSVILGIRSGSPIGLTNATVTLSSPDGTAQRCISVSQVGQVSVSTGTCP